MKIKKVALGAILAAAMGSAQADVCKFLPGNVLCGKGTVNSISGNGMVVVNGTNVNGMTTINGMLNAKEANFLSLQVNGSANLDQCIVNQVTDIKGSLNASATKFNNSVDIHSNVTTLVNSNINGNLRVHHTDDGKQKVNLTTSSITGDIIFDDGDGEVVMHGNSKVSGNIIGGVSVNK